MKSVTVQLPDRLAQELDAMVDAGWFSDPDEAVRLALLEFLRHHRLELAERFQFDDIAWALQKKHHS